MAAWNGSEWPVCSALCAPTRGSGPRQSSLCGQATKRCCPSLDDAQPHIFIEWRRRTSLPSSMGPSHREFHPGFKNPSKSILLAIWRREEDLNLRYPCRYAAQARAPSASQPPLHFPYSIRKGLREAGLRPATSDGAGDVAFACHRTSFRRGHKSPLDVASFGDRTDRRSLINIAWGGRWRCGCLTPSPSPAGARNER